MEDIFTSSLINLIGMFVNFYWNVCKFNSGIGSNQTVPSNSCKAIKDLHPSVEDGIYWINLTYPVKVFCDMTVDGGTILLILIILFRGHKFRKTMKFGHQIYCGDREKISFV